MPRFFTNLSCGLAAVMLAAVSLAEEVTQTEHRGSYARNGRILVSASEPHGYYLMSPAGDNRAKYESIECELAKEGQLDRISVSPSEKKVCFELRPTFDGEYRFVGHVLYIADFDAKAHTITNPKVIANAEANPALPFLYPRWTRDEGGRQHRPAGPHNGQ